MKLFMTWLALALVPSAVAAFVDCQTSCKSCQENDDEPEVVELYCSMCEECREKRRERLARRGLGHGPGHHVPAVGKYKGEILKGFHRKPRIDRRPPLRNYLMSSAVTPAHQMKHYYTQRKLRPLREYQYENLDPEDAEFLKTIPDGCPTPPICEDPTTITPRHTTTSTTFTTTTTTTTTPAPTCPPIPECVPTTTFRPPKKMTQKLRPEPEEFQDPPSCPCMPMCSIPMFCPCPCKVTTNWMCHDERPRHEKTTHVMSSYEATEIEEDIDKKSNDYVYLYVGVPKNLNKLIK